MHIFITHVANYHQCLPISVPLLHRVRLGRDKAVSMLGSSSSGEDYIGTPVQSSEVVGDQCLMNQ